MTIGYTVLLVTQDYYYTGLLLHMTTGYTILLVTQDYYNPELLVTKYYW